MKVRAYEFRSQIYLSVFLGDSHGTCSLPSV
jgi:hypothetical protein